MPPSLASRPDDSLEISFVLEAFSFLSRFRQSGGFGISPISFDSILTYARMVGYTDEDVALQFAEKISICDVIYLDKVAKDSKAKSESARKSKSSRHASSR